MWSTLIALLTPIVASPVERWSSDYSVGAFYFQTNGFDGNQLVANYIRPNGSLAPGCAVCTGGNGSAGINNGMGMDDAPYENHPDPFYGGGSVIVVGDQVMAVNAGSDTFSVFNLDPNDPGQVTWEATYPSMGDFPASLAASPDNNIVCVLNGGKNNGLACYQKMSWGWQHMSAWDRSFGQNVTTPPMFGPVYETPSQMVFAADMSSLTVAIKGIVTNISNNPFVQGGFIATYSIDSSMNLAKTPVKVPAAQPFSIGLDMTNPDTYFMTDVSTGYATYNKKVNNGTVKQGTVPNQMAVCWVAQSNLTKNFYVVDTATNIITEVQLNSATLNGTIVSSVQAPSDSFGTDIAMYYGKGYDWAYVMGPGKQNVYGMQISGPGNFKLVQTYSIDDMPEGTTPSAGFAGAAVYSKK